MATKTKPNKTKSDAIEAFFADISTRGQIALLETTTGTVRFDVSGPSGTEYWYVAIEKGEVSVNHRNSKADAVLRIDRDLLADITEGRKQAMAAILRGAMETEGDLSLMMSFQRLFPGRLGSTGRVAPITEVEQSR